MKQIIMDLEEYNSMLKELDDLRRENKSFEDNHVIGILGLNNIDANDIIRDTVFISDNMNIDTGKRRCVVEFEYMPVRFKRG